MAGPQPAPRLCIVIEVMSRTQLGGSKSGCLLCWRLWDPFGVLSRRTFRRRQRTDRGIAAALPTRLESCCVCVSTFCELMMMWEMKMEGTRDRQLVERLSRRRSYAELLAQRRGVYDDYDDNISIFHNLKYSSLCTNFHAFSTDIYGIRQLSAAVQTSDASL